MKLRSRSKCNTQASMILNLRIHTYRSGIATAVVWVTAVVQVGSSVAQKRLHAKSMAKKKKKGILFILNFHLRI